MGIWQKKIRVHQTTVGIRREHREEQKRGCFQPAAGRGLPSVCPALPEHATSEFLTQVLPKPCSGAYGNDTTLLYDKQADKGFLSIKAKETPTLASYCFSFA